MVLKETQKEVKEEEYYSPALEELKQKGVNISTNKIVPMGSSFKSVSQSTPKLKRLDEDKIVEKIVKIGVVRYEHFNTWLVKCAEYDEIKLKTKADKTNKSIVYPSCSLWKRRDET